MHFYASHFIGIQDRYKSRSLNQYFIFSGRAFGVQSLSGTGALRNGGDFLIKQLGKKICYVSDPTWGNHNMIFRDAGFQEVRKYRYWKKDTRYVYTIYFNGSDRLQVAKRIRDHPFKTSACLRGGGVSPCADGLKVTVHKDQKSPS